MRRARTSRSPTRRSRDRRTSASVRDLRSCELLSLYGRVAGHAKTMRDARNFADLTGRGHHAKLGGSDTPGSNDPPIVHQRGLRLPGTSGNDASAPDIAAYDVTGDVEIAGRVQPGTTGATQNILNHVVGGGPTGVLLALTANQYPMFQWGDGTTLNTKSASSAIPSGGKPFWLRALFDVDDGAGDASITFEYSLVDSEDYPTTWTEHQVIMVGATTSIAPSSALMRVGRNHGGGDIFQGLIMRALLKDGIDGTAVFDVDFTKATPGATAVTEDANGATVTIHQSGDDPARIVDRPMIIMAGDDFLEIDNEPKTTNLIPNPSFETNLTGLITRDPESEDWQRLTDDAQFGLAHASLDLTTGENDGAYYWMNDATTAGVEYTASAYFKRGSYTGNDPVIALWDDVTGFQLGNAITDVGEWRRSTVTGTFHASSTSRRVYLRLSGDGLGTTGGRMKVDGVQLEQAAAPTDYGDGDQWDWRWTGTPHASTSVQRVDLDHHEDESFAVIVAGRTYEPMPAAIEILFGTNPGIGSLVGWQVLNLSVSDTGRVNVTDGVVNSGDNNPADFVAGQAFVMGSRRNVVADEIEAFLDGVGSGSPSADNTTSGPTNDNPSRLGATSAGTPAFFQAGENHAWAKVKKSDLADLTDAEMAELYQEVAALAA